MLDAALHIRDMPASVAFVPTAIELLGGRPQLHDEVVREVLGIALPSLLSPEADQSGFIAAMITRASDPPTEVNRFSIASCSRPSETFVT